MDALLLLVACLALGAVIARFAHPPIGLAQALNWWVLNVALPALVLVLVPRIHFDPSLWFLVASQWLVFLGAWVLFAVIGRQLRWGRGRIGALVLVCGLGNTSFMGYPLIDALRGHEGLALAVIADQIGCFVALAVGGAVVAALYSGQQTHPLGIARRIVFFPPFVAFVVACGAGFAGGWPAMAEQVLERIGQTLTPLALFSVGLRLKLSLGKDQALPVFLGLSWKLLLAPLLVLALGVATGAGGLTLKVGVLEAAMAPMISAAILADQHKLEPPLANAVLGLGILLSLASVYAWHLALG
jgi:predicted permease